MRVLVVGFGNPSRMDDGIGHEVINRLNAWLGLSSIDCLADPADSMMEEATVNGHPVRTLWLQQLDLDLAEEAAQVDWLILVDAHLGGPAVMVDEVEPTGRLGPVSHVMTPGNLLWCAEAAFGARPRATIYSGRGERWDFGFGLSPLAAERAEQLFEQIVGALAGELAETAASD